ncbi:melanoma inhibitory activity protein 2-like isoform X1 [Myxocyprinus asiaticus]|uniref:melanoma inhibitory activity protein 2-like isoform X1 n=1 Tax=Myxocyprinus asiaticus TaxID=70543 RepID=UPI002222983B|nr:melanoma inhibitory activity protein 2-like isoform X1 [Myxocyprinus asiaticus]
MDIGEVPIEEKTNSGTLGWIRGELTNAFGIGHKNSEAGSQDSIEKPAKDSQQSSSWLSLGINVLGFGKDNTPVASQTEADSADEDAEMEDQSINKHDQSLDLVEDVQRHENNLDHSVQNADHTLEDIRSEDEKNEESGQTGWYGVYIGTSDQSRNDKSDDGKESLSKEESPGSSPNRDNSANKESESSSQSIFSASGLTSELDKLNFPFQSDKVKEDMESDEKNTEKKGDSGKEDLDDQQNEQSEISDVDEQDSVPIEVDEISETQSLSDDTKTLKDDAAFDGIRETDDPFQESNAQNNYTQDITDSEIPEDKSTDNSIEVIQSEINADVLVKEIEEDLKRNVESEEEMIPKKVDSSKEEFNEQQDIKKEEMSDVDGQDSVPINTDNSETKKTFDGIREIDNYPQGPNTQKDEIQDSTDLEIPEIKSADDLIQDIIERKSDLTDSNAENVDDVLKQSLSDQENCSIMQRKNCYDSISLDSISKSSDPADTRTSGQPESSLQMETELDDHEKQISAIADLETDSEIVTFSQSGKHEDPDVTTMSSKPTAETLSEHNDETNLAGENTVSETKDDSLSILDEIVMDLNETQSDEASEEITKNEETLEAISNEQNKSDKNINLDEGVNLGMVTSEGKMHSDLQRELNSEEEETENTSGQHDGLFEIGNPGVSIGKDIKSTMEIQKNSGDEHPDGVMVQRKLEESGTFSVSTEDDVETNQLKHDDTQIQYESLSQETNTKGPSLNITQADHYYGSGDAKDGGDDLNSHNDANKDNVPYIVNTGDPDDFTTSTETKLTTDLFTENNTVQDDNILSENQRDEQKEYTGEETGIFEESVAGATQEQSDDVDMTEDQGDEELPGRSHIQDKETFFASTEITTAQESSKEYINLCRQLTEQNIKDLLDLFGEHKLSWLDSKIGNSPNTVAGQDVDDDLAELVDFEQMLIFQMKMRATPGYDFTTNEYPALQKLFTLLSALREIYTPVIEEVSVDESQGISQDEFSTSQDDEDNQITDNRSNVNYLNNPKNELDSEEKDQLEKTIKVDLEMEDVQTVDREIKKHEDWKATSQNHVMLSREHVETEDSQKDEGQFYQLAAIVGEVTINELTSIIDKVVSSLPDDIRPGPDLYGLPWEAVVFTVSLGLFTLLLFSCRFIQSIKSRLYASKEKQMAQKVAELLDEKCKVLETFSEVRQKYEKLESTLQNRGMSAQAAEKDSLEVASQKLEQSNAQMKKEIERLQEELSQQNEARKQQEDQLAELEQILRNLEEEAKERKSQLEQDNTTLKIHEINTERLQKNLQAAKEEHGMLLESKEQLVQEAEGWGERLGELEEEMKMFERSHAGMLEDCANKDERIKSLTECLLKMRDWDSEDEKSIDSSNNIAGPENGDSSDFHQKQKVQKLIEAARMSADLKSMEEDKNRVLAKLTDEIKAKEDLQEGIKQFEEQKEMFESESAKLSSESQKLQQKLQIMTEMYQENELKLHRMLTVEEKERLQKEEKLNKAGKKISLAAEELNTYRLRAKDLEEELERTSHAYKNQITSHEKKAHDNWLAARAADRDLADVKRENANIRQRLTDAQFRLEMLEKDPYARESRPLFRGERSPYGPSPLGRPSSETRAFLSPPTLMDGPPRISPQFVMGPGGRASRGMVEPLSGGPDFERSGPHSDSGSLSPSWDRDRRGPPGPPGHPLTDPGLPYRRPPPGPYPMGPLPPRPPLRPEPYFGDKSESSFLRNSSAVSENDNREGPHTMSGDMRMPPDPDARMGPPPGPPLMGMPPPMDPRDPYFPHRGPYGPPEFFPPRGPGGPAIGMRGPLPPGMFPRVPLPFPQHMGYLPPRPPSDSFPPAPPPRPSPPGSEQPPDQSPSPHDVI